MVQEVLIEELFARLEEFEMEVMRDRADNRVVIRRSENSLDRWWIHTGDSITEKHLRKHLLSKVPDHARCLVCGDLRMAWKPAI